MLKDHIELFKRLLPPLINTKNQTFDGKLIYRENSNSQVQDLSAPVTIFESPKMTDDTKTQDITSNWTKDTGILLSTNKKISPAGKYTGTIQWTILDTLLNN